MSDVGQAQERIYLMKFKDHKNISRYLVKSHDCRIKARNRWALIIGSVIPDIAFYTYFRGSFNGQKLKGHNYENTSGLINHLIENIESDNKFGVKRYFDIGKLLHYSADSFTFAHNSHFKGNISAHRAYEMKLHERLEEAMSNNYVGIAYKGVSDMHARIKELHDRYVLESPDCQTDCSYIMYVLRYLYLMLAIEGVSESEMTVAA